MSSSMGVLSAVHLAVLLPSLMSMDLLGVVLSLELDLISSGVMMNKYLNVCCWSYYSEFIRYYYQIMTP